MVRCDMRDAFSPRQRVRAEEGHMDLTLILLFVLALVVVYATTQWKKISKLESGLRSETKALEEKRDELEKARKDARERRDELEESKKHLQEARNKLKKRDKEEP